MLTDSAFLRLLHLSSANLPVGAYSFSHGLESAIECGWLKTPQDIGQWLGEQMHYSFERVDLPVIFRLYPAQEAKDAESVRYWNDYALACRETAELRMTDTETALALRKLLNNFDISFDYGIDEYCHLLCLVTAARHWGIDSHHCCLAFLWSWLENQVIAATKLIALGQSRAQLLLHELQAEIPAIVENARLVRDEDIGSCQTALALSGSWHETQYSRLFRS